jgi:hypothetical protein
MSHIAAALAKSKGRTVGPAPETDAPLSTPPLGVSATPLPEETAARKKLPLPLVAGGVLALVGVVGGGLWFMFGRDRTPTAPPLHSPAKAAPAQPAPAPVKSPPAPPPSAKAPIASPPSASAAPAAVPAQATPDSGLSAEAALPSDEIFLAVRKLPVTAATTGPNAKAIIGKKVYYPGDEVMPGVTLFEIKDGLLIFRDQTGHSYPRRF